MSLSLWQWIVAAVPVAVAGVVAGTWTGLRGGPLARAVDRHLWPFVIATWILAVAAGLVVALS
jgi:hypothetical protein